MSQNLPIVGGPFGIFCVLRHPNHFVLAGANNRQEPGAHQIWWAPDVIITYRFLAVPVQANRDFFWHILTVHFNCNYFPQYTRELLEFLLGISPSGRNPYGGNNLTLHSNFKISRRFTLSFQTSIFSEDIVVLLWSLLRPLTWPLKEQYL